MTSRQLSLAWLALAVAAGCSLPREKVWLRVEVPAELRDAAGEVQVQPRIAESARKLGRGVLALELKRDAGRVRLVLKGACPLVVDASVLPRQAKTVALRSLFEMGPSERVVGIDQSFEIRAEPGCPEADALDARLAATGGAPLASVTVEQRGRLLRGRTRRALPEKSDSAGIVPVSAREQARLRTAITLRVQQPGAAPLERELGVLAVARSSGLPNVGLTHPVLLSNDAWTLQRAPHESRAALRPAGGLLELTPDMPGVYRLKSAHGAQLSLQSGRYDQTPLDCGRGDCHAELAHSAQDSAMTQTLASDLGGCHSLSNPECASACHAVGEPGTHDGGFTHVQGELGLAALPREHEELPRALQRLGGVGCAACHGPGAIPEPSGRWAILRSDVCAVCHDAPPRYGHVLAFASSRMAHADHAPELRQQPCARCHTTWGAVGRPAPAPEHGVESWGLGCATCHDVHPHGAARAAAAGSKTTHGLLRHFAMPETLSDPPASYLGPSRVCISCHAPSSSLLAPEASAAALLAGQGGLEPESGAALTLASPHALDPKGCLSCHDSGPEGLTLGESHGFRATETTCKRCHASGKPRDPSLARRAQSLFERLAPGRAAGTLDRPWHARKERAPQTPQLTRALYNVLLVLEDPAADVHHPAYARTLLDAAERLTPGAPP